MGIVIDSRFDLMRLLFRVAGNFGTDITVEVREINRIQLL
jgi:hypothetical protein